MLREFELEYKATLIEKERDEYRKKRLLMELRSIDINIKYLESRLRKCRRYSGKLLEVRDNFENLVDNIKSKVPTQFKGIHWGTFKVRSQGLVSNSVILSSSRPEFQVENHGALYYASFDGILEAAQSASTKDEILDWHALLVRLGRIKKWDDAQNGIMYSFKKNQSSDSAIETRVRSGFCYCQEKSIRILARRLLEDVSVPDDQVEDKQEYEFLLMCDRLE